MTFSNAAYCCRVASHRLREWTKENDALCQNLLDIAEELQAISLPRPIDDLIIRRPALMRELIGWLSGDIPELHAVEVPLLADSLDRFLATKGKPNVCLTCVDYGSVSASPADTDDWKRFCVNHEGYSGPTSGCPTCHKARA